MPPAIASSKSVKEVRPSERSYTDCSVSDIRYRQTGIHAGYGLLEIFQQRLRSRPRRADYENHGAIDIDGAGFEILPQQGPVDYAGRFLIHAVVGHVTHHADHFAPVILERGADAFADCRAWVVPQLTRHVL